MVDGVEMVFSKEKMIERLKKEGRADGYTTGEVEGKRALNAQYIEGE